MTTTHNEDTTCSSSSHLSFVLQEGDPGYLSELKQLQEEGEMSIDDLLASLPPEMLEESRPLTPDSNDGVEQEEEKEETQSRSLRKRKQPPETKTTKKQQGKKV